VEVHCHNKRVIAEAWRQHQVEHLARQLYIYIALSNLIVRVLSLSSQNKNTNWVDGWMDGGKYIEIKINNRVRTKFIYLFVCFVYLLNAFAAFSRKSLKSLISTSN
jgi:hypothetical protein